MTRYLGGLITKDESLVLPTNNFQDTSAPGVWTLEEAQALNKQGLWPTAGNTNPAKFVENIFSVDTYTGNGSDDHSIVNGIDLSGEGGLVWIKDRGNNNTNHSLFDTVRGVNKRLISHKTDADATVVNMFDSFNSNGFTLGQDNSSGDVNTNNNSYIAWTFRKASKFFDIVTYTGNGSNQNISHNLGATPGFVMVKKTSGTGHWSCWHRSLTSEYYILLNTTGAQADGTVGARTVNDSTYQIFGDFADEGADGATYVMYLFGHDTSSDGMIQCGTVDVDGSNNATVNLGFEPQWFLGRTYTSQADWEIHDTQRNWNVGNLSKIHIDTNAETTYNAKYSWATNIGFQTTGYFSGSQSLLYVAIRKAPMATPTARSDVFHLEAKTAGGTQTFTTGFPADFIMNPARITSGTATDNFPVVSRLQGGTEALAVYMSTRDDTAEQAGSSFGWALDHNNKYIMKDMWNSSTAHVGYAWRRAPSFMDVVVYEGTGSARTINHNLGVAPEMIWCKSRETVSSSNSWWVYHKNLPSPNDDAFTVNSLGDISTGNGTLLWNSTAPTSTVFSLGTYNGLNQSGKDYVAYLWATLAGISKVGSFSHTNGSSTDVDCGFSSGSSFVMVRRIDSGISNDALFYVWDSARGIVSGNDPYLTMNSNGLEVTGTDLIDPLNSGFQIASGFTTGDYIFYAIAA